MLRRGNGEGTVTHNGYLLIRVNGRRIYEHVYLAEKALGRRLPPKAEIHHMNEETADNHTPFNLVICPDKSYHRLLHDRMRRI